MDGWDSYDEGMDDIDTVDSFEESFTEPIDVDVSSTMDSIEPIEENIEYPVEDISFSEPEYVESVMDSVDVADVTFDDEPIIESSEETAEVVETVEEPSIELAQDPESSQPLENIEMSEDPIEDEDVKILTRDPTEQWETGNQAIEDTLEAMRDDLRDKGIEDGEAMEELIAQERSLLQEELSTNIDGDLSYHYDEPAWKDDPSILEGSSNDEVSGTINENEPSIEWNEDGSITIGQLEETEQLPEQEALTETPNTEDIDFTAEDSGLNNEDTIETIDTETPPVEWSEGETVNIDHTEETGDINEGIDGAGGSGDHSLDVMNDVQAEAVEFEDIASEEQVLEQPEISEHVEDNAHIDSNELPQTELENIDEIVDAHVALDNMSEYMNSHNYGLEDYEIYSQDPEWQALNRDLQIANGSEIQDALEGVVDQPPERVYDDFEQSVMENNPEFYETGSFYSQGVNSRGFEGTCGPTSQANAINKLLDTNELTENKVLDIAVENNLCNLEGPAVNCGGTTTEQFMELYNKVNEQIGDKINTELYEYGNALDANQVADRLDAGDVVNVAVDSRTLWGQPHGLADLLGVRREVISDHWITVTGVNRSDSGSIQGFDIIDSGGGESYVSLDRYNDMCFGTGSRIVKDPTCIVVSKKSNHIGWR